MMTKLYNQEGEIVGEIQLPENLFGLAVNDDVIHQAVKAQLANSRQVLAHTKDRSEVRGGGKKPWRQKGTGRARHGSIRSPLWRGGGVTFGPTKNRNFTQKINKKTKRKAMGMILSGKARDQQIIVLEAVNLEEAKTKALAAVFKTLSEKLMGGELQKQSSVLLIVAGEAAKIHRAVKNIPFAKTLSARSLNVVDLLSHRYILLIKDALPVIEQTYKEAN